MGLNKPKEEKKYILLKKKLLNLVKWGKITEFASFNFYLAIKLHSLTLIKILSENSKGFFFIIKL